MTQSKKYFDRELSWIQFNARVLTEAMEASNPLLERLKFLGIVSSNFDEFFMVRVSSLAEDEPLYYEMYQQAFGLIDKQNLYFQKELVPQLERADIIRVPHKGLTDEQYLFLEKFFHQELFPLLTPIALREGEEKTASLLVNLALYRVIEVMDPNQEGHKQYAVVEIPKNMPRMVSLPSSGGYHFILLEDVISLFAKELFQGYEILGEGMVRLTRAAEMTLNEEKDEDFSKIMTEALRFRRQSGTVRMEVSGSSEMISYLKENLRVANHAVYQTESWMDLKSISQLAFQPMFDVLKRPNWTPQLSADFENAEDVWDLLKEKDVLLNHPYESFEAFSHFIQQAANDPDVLAIKQTLYRVAAPSSILNALVKAAENGKQITVLVELKARFDEERNIEWAKRLVHAGATVLYGVAGFKTHAKACMVVRREPEGIRRYVHLGTGNYNEKTAEIYSDLSYFTSRDDFANDISAFFNVVTGLSRPVGFSKIEMAPFGLRQKIERLISRETMRSTKSSPGLILAKMNSLVDPQIIDALYEASKAGVKIKLNVRGVCGLKPGIKGLSENIEVISIIDMFLEHTRLFYFKNGGEEEIYLSSADMMPRNLDRRLEIFFPLDSSQLKTQAIDLLHAYFRDNIKSWQLLPNGDYQKKKREEKEKKFRVQDYLCRKALQENQMSRPAGDKKIRPQRARP